MNTPKKAWRHWFSGRAAVSRLPESCVMDCSVPGQDASEAVEYWVKRLQFEAPPWLLREDLKAEGCWTDAQLCDHQENLKRFLWIWACRCREEQDMNWLAYLGV